MTDEQKEWIDNASYLELLRKWRFVPSSDGYFTPELTLYYEKVMSQRKAEIGPGAAVAASKVIGWEAP